MRLRVGPRYHKFTTRFRHGPLSPSCYRHHRRRFKPHRIVTTIILIFIIPTYSRPVAQSATSVLAERNILSTITTPTSSGRSPSGRAAKTDFVTCQRDDSTCSYRVVSDCRPSASRRCLGHKL